MASANPPSKPPPPRPPPPFTRAKSFEVDQDSFSERFFTCTICLDNYTEAPKLLPCLHSFCKRCLIHMTKGQRELNCPVCRRTVQIPARGIDAFPNNIFIRDLQDFLSEQPRRASVQPSPSSREAAVPSIAQRERAVTASASSLSLSGQINGGFFKRAAMKLKLPFRSKKKRYCSYHQDRELKFYCETCQIVTCKKCAKLEHGDGHMLLGINTASESQIHKLNVLLNEAKSHILPLEQSRVAVSHELDKLNARKDKVKKTINDTFGALVQAIEQRQNTCLSRLESAVQNKQHALNRQLGELEHGLSTVRSGCQFTQQTLAELRGNDYEVMMASNQLAAQLEELVSVRSRQTCEPVENACLTFEVQDEEFEGLRHLLSNVGDLRRT